MAGATPSSVGIPTVDPSATAPDVTQHLRPSAETFGAGVGEAMQNLGRSSLNAAQFFNDAAADSAANTYQEEINKLLHGDPNKTIIGPDGQPQQDLGYLGLKGRAALDARPALEKAMEDARRRAGQGLPAIYSQTKFDSYTRRFKAIASNQVGQHADNQGNLWYKQVNGNRIKVAEDTIANSPDNPALLLEQREVLRSAYIRQSQLDGLDDPDSLSVARKKADAHALLAQAGAISTTNPQRALEIIESGRGILGTDYEKAYNHFRPRAEQEQGRSIGRAEATGTGSGGDFKNNIGAIGYTNINYAGKGGGYSPDAGRKFETFGSPEEGVAAAYGTMVAKAKQNGGKITFNDLIGGNGRVQGWAPAANGSKDPMLKGNAPSAYADRLAKSVGLKGSDEVPLGDDAKMARVLEEQNKIEHGRKTVPDDAYGNGIKLAKGDTSITPTKSSAIGDEDTYAAKRQRILDRNLPPVVENAALAELAKYHAAQQNQRVADHAAFDLVVKNSVAEAMQTGQTSDPIPEDHFVRQYGPSKGRAEYVKYYADLQFGQARQEFENLSDHDIQARIDQQLPAPGDPAYAERIKNVERLRKYADELQKQRIEDPAGVAQRMPAVRTASAMYNPQDPSSFAPVMEARLKAQTALGIDPEYQSPITKSEALKMTAPLVRMIPGKEKETYTQVANNFQQMFGDNAQQALAYALRARKVAAEEAQQAAAVMRTVAKGALTRSQAGDFDTADELNASRNAVTTTRPPRAQPRVIGNPEEHQDMTTEPSTISEKPPPPPRAISLLLRDPSTAETFDIKYGTGMAKRILERYSGAVGGR